MSTRTLTSLFVLATSASLAFAQETYWVAGNGGVMQIDASGFRHQTVPPSTGRDVGVAPDGKIWILGATITVLNPDGSGFTTITPGAGQTPYDIAFDRAGHAWVTGGTNGDVEEFDANGVSLGVVPLAPGAPLGITVDADGNKWIAHRIGPPGSLSRIDGVTRQVTTHSLPAGSLILPVNVYADSRGFAMSSHIWVVGDNRGAGELVEFDATGTALNTYVISASARLKDMTVDVDATGAARFLYVGDWGNGDLHKVDVATGLFTTFPNALGVYGPTFDGFGDLWISFRGGSEVQRIDETTGTPEVVSNIGATGPIETRWQYATVVDQLGDLDGDGGANLPEAMSGSSPFSACSTGSASLSIGGSMASGSTVSIDVLAGAGVGSLIAFATATASPGIAVPGIGCSVVLDPATHLGNVFVLGPASLPITIPVTPSFVGFRLLVQALNGGVPTFTNVAPMLFY